MSRRKQPRPQHYSTSAPINTATATINPVINSNNILINNNLDELKLSTTLLSSPSSSSSTSTIQQDLIKQQELNNHHHIENNQNNQNNSNHQNNDLDIIIAKVNSQAIDNLENHCSSIKSLDKSEEQESKKILIESNQLIENNQEANDDGDRNKRNDIDNYNGKNVTDSHVDADDDFQNDNNHQNINIDEDINNENYDCVNLKKIHSKRLSPNNEENSADLIENSSPTKTVASSSIFDNNQNDKNNDNAVVGEIDKLTENSSPRKQIDGPTDIESSSSLVHDISNVKKSINKHNHSNLIVENGHSSTIIDQQQPEVLSLSTSLTLPQPPTTSSPLITSMFDIQKFDHHLQKLNFTTTASKLSSSTLPKSFNFNQFPNNNNNVGPFNVALLQSSPSPTTTNSNHNQVMKNTNTTVHHHHHITTMAPTGKNLCDKCGGSYATLAALISHKKSCKSKKKSTTNTTISADSLHSSASSSISNNNNLNHNNSDGLINNNKLLNESNSDSDQFFHHLRSHQLHHSTNTSRFNALPPSLLHQQIQSALASGDEQSLSKLMAMEAAAAASMDHNSTATSPSTSQPGLWPQELLPSLPTSVPSSSSTAAAAFATAASMPDMNAFLESLAPLFQAQQQRSDSNPEQQEQQQQAALFTQQMMLFHMFQQMQQQVATGQLPTSFPLFAAAAAAAAAQQSTQLAASASVSPSSHPPSHHTHQSMISNSSTLFNNNDENNIGSKKSSLSTVFHQHSSSSSKNISRTLSNSSSTSSSSQQHSKDSSNKKESNNDATMTSNNGSEIKDHQQQNQLSCDQRPGLSTTPTSDRGSGGTANAANPNQNTRKLLSSLLDLKDTNPDAPLPPMMSPPKVSDSSESVPPFNEPNTLELLQKHTEQALQNTMSGGSFLLNGLSAADNNELLNFRKGKDGKEDPSNRHRCKFCGKVFGSDSALQIHIRSHTGERPFKCNVCGNRFTTKGNLKVHFQRHKAKYPHVKMNSHPVPEHLDKLYPPLEPASNSQSPPPPPIPPTSQSSASTSGTNLFSPTTFPVSSSSNTFNIPAIFSSTLMPYASADDLLMTSNCKIEQNSCDKTSKSKLTPTKTTSTTKSLFDFADFYKNGNDSLIDSTGDDENDDDDDEDDDDDAVNGDIVGNENDSKSEPDLDLSSNHKNENNQSDCEEEQQKLLLPPMKSDHIRLFDGSDTDMESDNDVDEIDNNHQDKATIDDQVTTNKKTDDQKKDEKNEGIKENNKNDSQEEKIRKKEQYKEDKEQESSLNIKDDKMNEDAQDRLLNEESFKMEDGDEIDEDEYLNTQADEIDDTDDDDLDDDMDLNYNDSDIIKDDDDLLLHHHHRFGLMSGLPFNMDSGVISNSVSLPAPSNNNNNNDNNDTSVQSKFPSRPISDSVSESDCAETTTKDPILYQNLLPKPGSTDNTWETLMEVQKASETVKLQQLVDNIEHKLNDPNQCIICQRVLSCKSALQMHYRTHTGERPFKCKICGRAFTTKGNLKTHMGVHRVKPPLRMLHQCPICHKQFTNALVLQQHIRLHSIDPTGAMPPDVTPEMLNEFHKQAAAAANPNLNFPRSFLPIPNFAGNVGGTAAAAATGSSASSFPPTKLPTSSTTTGVPGAGTGASGLFPSNFLSEMAAKRSSSASSPSPLDLFNVAANFPITGANTASTTADPSTTTDDSTNDSLMKEALDEDNNDNSDNHDDKDDDDHEYSAIGLPQPKEKRKNPEQDDDGKSDKDVDEEKQSTMKSSQQQQQSSMTPDDIRSISDTTEIEEDQQQLSQSSMFSPAIKKKKSEDKKKKQHQTLPQENTLSALEHHVMKSTSEQMPPKFMPSKTDKIALDLTPKVDSGINGAHHPIEPFPSKVNNRNIPSGGGKDRRGFPSTPFAGLPYHPTGRPNTTCRICLKTFACFSALEIHYRSHTKERPFKCEVCDRGFSTKGNMKQHMLTHKIRDLPPDLYTTISPTSNTTLGNFLTSNSITKIIGKQVAANNTFNTHINPSHHHHHHHHNSNNNNNQNNSSSTTNHSVAAMASSSNNSNSSSRVSSPHTPNGNSMDSMDKFNRNTESPATESSQNTNPRSSSTSTSSNNKHMCNICNKPFSSGSALQIHMRTHTGDKPFKCTICGRAFTTKGNLKVHMGTHIYNNNPSRRGRRMSIDLPGLASSLHHHQQQQSSPTSSTNPVMERSPSSQTTSPVVTPKPQQQPLPLPSSPVTIDNNINPIISTPTNNPETDLFLRYLTNSHFLNAAGNDVAAGQFALQQMMLMKMMSSHHQQPLLPPTHSNEMQLDKSFMMNMTVQANKKIKRKSIDSSNGRGNNGENNDHNDDDDNISDNEDQDDEDDGNISKEKIDLNNESNNNNRKRTKKHDISVNNDDNNDRDDDDDMENLSDSSSHHHQTMLENSSNWMKPLKCTLCQHVCHSPMDFDEHIKAHLHAAAASVAAANASAIKTTADVVS